MWWPWGGPRIIKKEKWSLKIVYMLHMHGRADKNAAYSFI